MMGNITVLTAILATLFAQTISVKSQADYDNLNDCLVSLQGRTPFIVKFAPGEFRFNNSNEILLNNLGPIKFVGGKNTFFVSDGEDYSFAESCGIVDGKWYKVPLKAQLDLFCTYQTMDYKMVPIAETGWLNFQIHSNLSPSKITLVKRGVAKVRIPTELKSLSNKDREFFKNSFLCYKAQWTDCIRSILYSDDSFIYFEISDYLTDHFESYVGSMYEWSRLNELKLEKYTPFFLVNIPCFAEEGTVFFDDNFIYIPTSITHLHVCRFNKLMAMQSESGVVLDGLNIRGASTDEQIISYGDNSWKRSALIEVKNSSSIAIRNSTMQNVGVSLCCIENSEEVEIDKCRFENNYTDGIIRFQGSRNKKFRMSANYIENPHKLITHIPCVDLYCVDGAIFSNNTVINISRTFLRCGKGGNISVLDNVIYNTLEFNKFRIRNTSSDTGALVYSYADAPITIEGNVVHCLPSNLRYNAIMIDNGTGNASIRNNLLYDIGDYAVFCWRNQQVAQSNHNNVLDGNIILSKIDYQGFDQMSRDNAIYKNNYFSKEFESVMRNSMASDKGGNVYFTDWSVKNGKVELPHYVSINFCKCRNIINNLQDGR